MMGSFITRGIIMVLGYVYPAYECYKIVEKKRPDLEHLRFWCQYWMIIAMVTVLERLADVLVSWVPMYSEAKLAFIIYLWYPKTMGTTYVYSTFVRPFVAKHEPEIDRNLNELRTRAGDLAVLWWQRSSVYVQARFYELLQYVASQSNRSQQSSIPPLIAALTVPKRSTSQGPSQGPTQGGPQVYPPPPQPSTRSFTGSAPGGAGYPAVNADAPYPPAGLGTEGGLPPIVPAAPAVPPSIGSGLRGELSEDDGDSDYDVIENRAEDQVENQVERPLPKTGGQGLPQRVYNTRNRQRANGPPGAWNWSSWLPTWPGTASSEKVD